ncbi:MAG: hypothetical protein HOW97_14365 [Catenulispora sp.]|nr:hypothetical protein [Catenulispora sp.]
MPNQASPALSRPSAGVPAALAALPPDALAPDLVALFLGATPHPDIVIPEPRVTIAELAAIARARGGGSGAEGGSGTAVLRWDAAGQRFAS